MPNEPSAVALAIKAQLDATGPSIRQLAANIGMSSWALNRRLTGETRLTVDEVIMIARALGVPPEFFVTEAAAA